jgi:O-antigen/teichoic acid export membrane protein
MNRREYFKHFTQLFTGSFAAQLLNFAAYPLLARLYSPMEFGVFATFVAAAAIPSEAACARFDLAVPTAPQWGRFAILWLCILISAVAALFWGAGAAVYWLVVEGRATNLQPLLFGLCVGLTGFCAAGSLYLLRNNLYGIGAIAVAIRTGGAVLAQVAIGLIWSSSLALIIGFAAGLLAQAIVVGWAILKYARPKRPRPSQMRILFERYKWQVAVDIPNTVVAGLALNLPTFFIAASFGQRVVGFYGLAHRIAIAPIQDLTDALSQIYFQKAARSYEERGSFWPELELTLLASSLLAAGLVPGILLFAKPVVVTYLGARWEPVATILAILAPMLATRSIISSIHSTTYVLRRAWWLLVHNLANVLVVTLAFLTAVLGSLGSTGFFELMALLASIEYVLFGTVLVIAARRHVLRSPKTELNPGPLSSTSPGPIPD